MAKGNYVALLHGGPRDGETVMLDSPAHTVVMPRITDEGVLVHDAYGFDGTTFAFGRSPYTYEGERSLPEPTTISLEPLSRREQMVRLVARLLRVEIRDAPW